MPDDRRTLVAAVVDPDEEIREAGCLLLKLEFGLQCEAAQDFPSLLRTLSVDRLSFIVARLGRTMAFAGTLNVPIIPIDGLPIDAGQLVEAVRTVAKVE